MRSSRAAMFYSIAHRKFIDLPWLAVGGGEPSAELSGLMGLSLDRPTKSERGVLG